MNDLLLRALKCEKVERPPVWFMRQAGRFLPEYRELRKVHTLNHLFHTPELAAQVTRQPLDILGVDAAILFSDILVITEVFGYRVDFPQKGGIHLEAPAQATSLSVADTLHYVKKTIQLLKPTLNVPLIGFCGGPFTVAKYMQQISHEWLEKITEASIAYLRMQIEAGIDAVQIFDSWAGVGDASDFYSFSLPYLKKIVDALRPEKIPVILFCRGSCRFARELANLKPAAISFDWEQDLLELRTKVPQDIAVQGNLDPEIFRGPLPALEKAVECILESMKESRGFIFNLGHGVLPDTPVENALAVIKQVQYSNIHKQLKVLLPTQKKL